MIKLIEEDVQVCELMIFSFLALNLHECGLVPLIAISVLTLRSALVWETLQNQH